MVVRHRLLVVGIKVNLGELFLYAILLLLLLTCSSFVKPCWQYQHGARYILGESAYLPFPEDWDPHKGCWGECARGKLSSGAIHGQTQRAGEPTK